ncbi:hypothetical protein ACS0TY_021545 [Phlomoides rotata]
MNEKNLVVLKELDGGEQPLVVKFEQVPLWIHIYDLLVAVRNEKNDKCHSRKMRIYGGHRLGIPKSKGGSEKTAEIGTKSETEKLKISVGEFQI